MSQKNMEIRNYDVVVVGGGIAGCTAAILFARNGLKVALLERNRESHDFKKACTHYVQASATPVVQRLGLDTVIEQAGGLRNSIDTWTKWGWIKHETGERFPKYGYSIRREKLDPLMRKLAEETEGLDLLLGYSVKALVKGSKRTRGVIAQHDHEPIQFNAQLVVGADGSRSAVAHLADVPVKERENERFIYWAYYEGIPRQSAEETAQMWLCDPDVAYYFPSDNGVGLFACIVTKDKLEAFKKDRLENFENFITPLPDAPNIKLGKRITDVMGTLKYPNFERQSWMPGLALVGDAAVASDPIWGVGCGWAFQSAEWLVDCTSEAIVKKQDLKASLKRYHRKHSFIRTHNSIIADYSSGRTFNGLEALYFKAGVVDQRMALLSHNLGSRHINPVELFYPTNLLRAIWLNFKHRKRLTEAEANTPLFNYEPEIERVQRINRTDPKQVNVIYEAAVS